jgi:hypothetical protein
MNTPTLLIGLAIIVVIFLFIVPGRKCRSNYEGTCATPCASDGPEGCCECQAHYPMEYGLHHTGFNAMDHNVRECMCKRGFNDFCYKLKTNYLLSQ